MVHVVCAGGGSAGHTSPLIAVAEQLRARGVTVSCVGTADKLEATVIPAAGLEIDFIPRVPMPRSPSVDLLKLPFRLSKAIRRTTEILRERGADAVIGFGGYVSPPAYLAARRLGLPILIHEQNALPGLANKMGARFAARVGVTYRNTPLPHAVHVGLPLREALAQLDRAAAREQARASLGLDEDRPTLLVSGGSLGARSINEATTAALDDLLEKGFDVVHVWGKANFTDQRTRRHESGATYLPLPFVEAMEIAYAASDLMLGRAGSNTVNETAVVGLPQIYVPLPHGNGEQALNCADFVDAGCGILVRDPELSADWLSATVTELLHDADRLAEMGAAGRRLVPADAAATVADWAIEEATRHAA